MKKLRKTIYAALRYAGTDDEYIAADTERAKLIEDDGPTIVGTYQLVETHELTKAVQEKKR